MSEQAHPRQRNTLAVLLPGSRRSLSRPNLRFASITAASKKSKVSFRGAAAPLNPTCIGTRCLFGLSWTGLESFLCLSFCIPQASNGAEIDESRKVALKPVSDVLAGALARAGSQSTIHPLDTLKVRLQTSSSSAAKGISKIGQLVPLGNEVRQGPRTWSAKSRASTGASPEQPPAPESPSGPTLRAMASPPTSSSSTRSSRRLRLRSSPAASRLQGAASSRSPWRSASDQSRPTFTPTSLKLQAASPRPLVSGCVFLLPSLFLFLPSTPHGGS